MDRRILIQVTAPAVVLGLALLGTCLVSAWIVNRLQSNLSRILSENVSSLEAAQDLETCVRTLHFHCFRYLVDPDRAAVDQQMQQDREAVHRAFQQSLQAARQAATTPEEEECLRQIEDGYDRYRREFRRLRDAPPRPRLDYRALTDGDPLRHVVEPCERYVQVNKGFMDQTRQESGRVSRLLHVALLLLGIGGPASGLILGWGMARGLSRSIHRLSVRVHDMTQHLDETVASVSVVPEGDVRDLDRQLERAVVRVREVAEQLQDRQREVLRAQQMAAVGQLAASVAHEVRNPLMSIKMLVDAALRPHKPRPLTSENLAVIRKEVGRLERTVQGFLAFTRPPPLQREPCDLRTVLAGAVALMGGRAEQQRVEVRTRTPDRPVTAVVDAGQLSGVLVNLLLNALDAMPAGGLLELSLEEVAGGPGVPPGIRLAVADTGSGIPPGMEGRLFTPFVSSKPTGTGLGLCICRRVIEDHGGRIRGENRPAGGACFTITLPGEDNHAGSSGD